jgi:CDP-diacylglycerol--serine O-phosphatidyltransferase
MTPKYDGTIEMSSDTAADELPALPSLLSRIIPNAVTVVALCCGMTAIELAIIGKYRAAALALILAGIFDGLDGRAARMLKATSTFGAELDSLSDLVSFGVAPAVLLYTWSLTQLASIGWAFTVFFTVCCGLRLARFNTQLRGELPSLRHHFFTGVPAPAGAGLALVPMFMNFASGNDFFRSPILNAFVIAVVGLMMISRVPTLSLKRIMLTHDTMAMAVVGGVVIVASLVVAPWTTLSLGGILYAATMPIGSIIYHRLLPSEAAPTASVSHSSVHDE